MKNVILSYDKIDSPIGIITVLTNAGALCYLDFEGNEERLKKLMSRRFNTFSLVEEVGVVGMKQRLQDYFSQDEKAFDGLSLNMGGTDFQQRVWRQLQLIQYGSTCSYSQMAEAIGKPAAIRAVANANALNPISIVVPCHRVVGKNGTLTGYAGGLDRKQWLLQHEGVT